MGKDPQPQIPSPGNDSLLDFCRGLPGVTEDVKWGDNLVFSVALKMFAVFDLPDRQRLSFKVDPLIFETLTGQDGIIPAPYLARHHWVAVTERERIPQGTLEDFLEESHRLVAAKLPKKTRQALAVADD